MEQQNSSLFSLNLDEQNSYSLRSVASWAKVLGIVSTILAILCFIAGIIFQQNVDKIDISSSYKSAGLSSDSLGNMVMVVYVIIGLLYGVSGMFALNAGNKINTGLKTKSMEILNGGFVAARNFFAFWAILMIIFLSLMLISILTAM